MHAHLPSRVQIGTESPTLIEQPAHPVASEVAPQQCVSEDRAQLIAKHRAMQALCVRMASFEGPVNANYWLNEARKEQAIVKALEAACN